MHTHFENMTPVLALIIQSFIQHLHDLHKVVSKFRELLATFYPTIQQKRIVLIISHLSNLVHLLTRWAPRIIRRRIPNLCLYIRVPFSVILNTTNRRLSKVLQRHRGKLIIFLESK